MGQILEHLKTDFANTNEQYARMALLTPQTDSLVTRRVIHDYRQAYQPMGLPMMKDVFEYNAREKTLLPQLKKKLYLINVDYIPTNETPLQELTGASYELVQMHGTSHFPMIETPQAFNDLLGRTVQKIVAK